MSARSVVATLKNTTNQTLTLLSASLDHGVWITRPPAAIAAGASGIWQADSDGFATGVQGLVQYQIGQPTQSVSAFFDDPFEGSNQFTATCAPPTAFQCTAQSPPCNVAQPAYTLSAVSS